MLPALNESVVCVPVLFAVIPQQELCTPLHVTNMCDGDKTWHQEKFGQILRLRIPRQCSSIYSCEQTNIAEYRTSSALILRICRNPLIVARTCTVFLLLMLSML